MRRFSMSWTFKTSAEPKNIANSMSNISFILLTMTIISTIYNLISVHWIVKNGIPFRWMTDLAVRYGNLVIFEIQTHSCKDIITYLNKWMNYCWKSVTLYESDAHSQSFYLGLSSWIALFFIHTHSVSILDIVRYFFSGSSLVILNENARTRHAQT